jgi:hypothetical protein
MDRFLSANVFSLSSAEQEDIEAFMMVFPTDLAPIVGQQVTLTPGLLAGTDASDVNARADLILGRAGAGFTSQILGAGATECDAIARVVEAGGTQPIGYLRQTDGTFLPDDGSAAITSAALRAKATVAGQEVTLSCVPPGSGPRMSVDRDEDGVLNGLDNCPGAPNDALGGTCTAGEAALLATECAANADCGTGGLCSLAQEDSDLDGFGDACEPSLVPEPGFGAMLAAGALALAARRRGATA